MLLALDDSRALYCKNAKVREIETEAEEEIFLDSGLTLVVIAEASRANEPHLRRSTRTSQAQENAEDDIDIDEDRDEVVGETKVHSLPLMNDRAYEDDDEQMGCYMRVHSSCFSLR